MSDDELFQGLPVQTAPTWREAAEHWLEQCEKCRGTGRHRYSYYGGGYSAQRGSEPCRHCNGGGRVIRYVGPVIPPVIPTP